MSIVLHLKPTQSHPKKNTSHAKTTLTKPKKTTPKPRQNITTSTTRIDLKIPKKGKSYQYPALPPPIHSTNPLWTPQIHAIGVHYTHESSERQTSKGLALETRMGGEQERPRHTPSEREREEDRATTKQLAVAKQEEKEEAKLTGLPGSTTWVPTNDAPREQGTRPSSDYSYPEECPPATGGPSGRDRDDEDNERASKRRLFFSPCHCLPASTARIVVTAAAARC